MTDLYYISEKFGKTVHTLAVMDAPLKERLQAAYQSEAMYAHTVGGGHKNAQPSDELMARMVALRERVTRDGSFQISFLVLSDEEVSAVAEEILAIYYHVEGDILELQLAAERKSGEAGDG